MKEIEPYRKKHKSSNNGLYFIGILWLLALFLFVTSSFKPFYELITNPFCIFIPLLVFLFSYPAVIEKQNIKAELYSCTKEKLSSIIWELFPDIRQVRNDIFSRYDISKHGLLDSGYIYQQEDCFLACYKGVDIRVADLSCRDAAENLIKEFRGSFLTLFLDKNIKGHTIVKPRKFSLILFFCYLPELLFIFLTIIGIITVKNNVSSIPSWLSLILILICFSSYLYFKHLWNQQRKNVRLEDVGFMKEYTVTSTDQLASRLFLTPAFMQRIKKLRMSFGKKDIMFSIVDNELLIIIPTNENIFEIGDVYKPLDRYDSVRKLYSDVVDYLQLDS